MKIKYKIELLLIVLIPQILCMSQAEFLLLPDSVIWEQSLKLSSSFGKCGIVDSRTHANACDYYAKTNYQTGSGLPDNIGSGCLYAPQSSCPTCTKNVAVCWGSPNTYQTYNSTSTPVCTSNHITNGANMIRIGVKKKYCDISLYNYTNSTTTPKTPTTTKDADADTNTNINKNLNNNQKNEYNMLSIIALLLSIFALLFSVISLCLNCYKYRISNRNHTKDFSYSQDVAIH